MKRMNAEENGRARVAGAAVRGAASTAACGRLPDARLAAVILQRTIAANVSGFHGGIAQAGALARHDPHHAGAAIAGAFGTTFWVAFALTAAALVPALLPPAKADEPR
jgi:hypothetical protein